MILTVVAAMKKFPLWSCCPSNHRVKDKTGTGTFYYGCIIRQPANVVSTSLCRWDYAFVFSPGETYLVNSFIKDMIFVNKFICGLYYVYQDEVWTDSNVDGVIELTYWDLRSEKFSYLIILDLLWKCFMFFRMIILYG